MLKQRQGKNEHAIGNFNMGTFPHEQEKGDKKKVWKSDVETGLAKRDISPSGKRTGYFLFCLSFETGSCLFPSSETMSPCLGVIGSFLFSSGFWSDLGSGNYLLFMNSILKKFLPL